MDWWDLACACDIITLRLISNKLKALPFELVGDVEHKHVIEWHMMAITSKYDHLTLVQNACMTISWEWTDATNASLTLLRERHVQTEGVISMRTKSKVILLALEVGHHLETWVSVSNEQTPLHVSRGG